jgi:hypothetical protein
MVTLAQAAAESLPKTTITETMLASRSGWMIYDKPYAELTPDKGSLQMDGAPLIGMAWDCVPLPLMIDQDGNKVIGTDHGCELTPCLLLFPLVRSRVSNAAIPASYSYRELGSDLDHSYARDKRPDRIFAATHLLMQQTLAWVESQHPPRHMRRQASRMGLPAEPITVVKLRKLEHAPDPGAGELVAWTHRWLVSGHWRQQWYPSTMEHRPIWISPHVKGPEDKPLVLKEKVTAWVR